MLYAVSADTIPETYAHGAQKGAAYDLLLILRLIIFSNDLHCIYFCDIISKIFRLGGNLWFTVTFWKQSVTHR